MPSQDHKQRRLIVNADDLGLHEDINRGIEQAHKQGIVTSASIVACGEAFDHAVDVLRNCPNLDVGVHLTLVGGERPLSPSEEIRSLVGADGRFPLSYRQFMAGVSMWAVRSNEIRRELEAQIKRVIQAGLKPTHMDGHQHVLRVPLVWGVVKELAREYGIRWIREPWYESILENSRSPLDPIFRAGLNFATLSTTSSFFGARRSEGSITASPNISAEPQVGIRTTGLESSGRLTESDLSRLITGLRPGTYELVTHPGVTTPSLAARYPWSFSWSEELAALTSPRIIADLQAAGVQLTRFSEA